MQELNNKSDVVLSSFGEEAAVWVLGSPLKQPPPTKISSNPSADFLRQTKAEFLKKIKTKILKEIKKGQGLPPFVWKLIQTHSEALRDESIARVAYESSLYKVSIDAGLTDPFCLGLAALSVGDRNKFAGAFSDPSLPLIQKHGLSILRQRVEGRLTSAITAFEFELEPMLKSDDVSDEVAGDLTLIGATAYFYAGNYFKAQSLYEKTYELFNFAGKSGKAAIAAFNTAVAWNHLGKKEAVSDWKATAEYHLSQFQVPGLRLSMDLFEIECLAGEAEVSKGLLKTEGFLTGSELTASQNILALQTKARLLLEAGRLIESEIALGLSRQVIAQKGFDQFKIQQQALELEIEALTYRKLGTTQERSSLEKSPSLRAVGLVRLARVRNLLSVGDVQKAQKAFHDFSVQTPSVIQNNLYFKDIEITLMTTASSAESRPRGFQAQFFQAIRTRNYPQLHFSARSFSEGALASTPWGEALLGLSRAFTALGKADLSIAHEEAEKVILVTERNGLDRLYSIALAISSACDPHRQLQWNQHVRSIPKASQVWLQDLLAPLLPKDIFRNAWIITSSALETEVESEPELIIDQNLGQVQWMGEILPITGQSILFRLLVQMCLSQSKGLDKSDLVQLTWGYRYDPLVHDPLIYMNVRRLRKLVPIELYQGRYRLSGQIKWKCLASSSLELALQEENLSERQKSIVNLIRSTQNRRISRKEVAGILQISPRTALRELTRLVDLKIVDRDGFGRGAYYFLKDKGA